MVNLKSSIQLIIKNLEDMNDILLETEWVEGMTLKMVLIKAEVRVDKAISDIEKCKKDWRRNGKDIHVGLDSAQKELKWIPFEALKSGKSMSEFADLLWGEIDLTVNRLTTVINSLDEEEEMEGLSLSEDDYTYREQDAGAEDAPSCIDDNPNDNMNQLNEIYVTLVGFQYHISETERSKYGVGSGYSKTR